MHRHGRRPRGFPVSAPSVPCPTDGLEALTASARASRVAASALRWLAACALAFAALLAVAVALAEVDRTRGPDPALPSRGAAGGDRSQALTGPKVPFEYEGQKAGQG